MTKTNKTEQMAERLREVLSSLDLAEVAKACNVSRQAVDGWKRTGRISKDNVPIVANMAGRSLEWLLNGVESTGKPVQIPAGASVRAYEDPSELDPNSYVWVERYDVNLSAGCGNIQWVVQKEDPLAFRIKWFQSRGYKPENCKALYVRGRSMEPHLNDMDTVLVDTSQTTVVDGEIYALCYMDEFYIKTVLKIPGGYRLKSENPAFDSFDVLGENLNQLHIIGQKVWRAG